MPELGDLSRNADTSTTTAPMPTILSLMVLTGFALVAGALALSRRGGSRLQIALMLALAAIIAANVAIWVLPTRGSAPPLARTPE